MDDAAGSAAAQGDESAQDMREGLKVCIAWKSSGMECLHLVGHFIRNVFLLNCV
jgi:hypothetical protein